MNERKTQLFTNMPKRISINSVIIVVCVFLVAAATAPPQTDGDKLVFCCDDDIKQTPRISETSPIMMYGSWFSVGYGCLVIPGLFLLTNAMIERFIECLEYERNRSPPPILRGEFAEENEFPHMVAVGFENSSDPNSFEWMCGATIISPRYVLTAAHCTFSRSHGRPKMTRLGSTHLRQHSNHVQQIPIESITVHPSYTSRLFYNDIALLKLATPVTFSDHIRPACIYRNLEPNETSVIAMGWGAQSFGGGVSDDLMKVTLPIESQESCATYYGTHRKLQQGIKESQMCTRIEGKDTCQGDSGRPLVIARFLEGSFDVFGITSFGRACGNNAPGVATRVSHYLDWIESIVWPY